MLIGGFTKLLNIIGNLEAHGHTKGYVHAQERPEKDLNSHLA